MTSVKKKSPLWKYFDVCKEDGRYAKCSLCELKISRGGEGKKAGTSAMKNHVKTKHTDKLLEIWPDLAAGIIIPSTHKSASGRTQKQKEQKQMNFAEINLEPFHKCVPSTSIEDNSIEKGPTSIRSVNSKMSKEPKSSSITKRIKCEELEQNNINYADINRLEYEQIRDRFTVFGEHVANKIRTLRTEHAQNMVEHIICNTLWEATLGKYDNTIQLLYNEHQETEEKYVL